MKCLLCNSNVREDYEFIEEDNLDYYAYCHGKSKTVTKIKKYICTNCGKEYNRQELPFATTPQLHLISKLFESIDYRSFYKGYIIEKFSQISKNEANKLIHLLKNNNYDYKEVVEEYINNNVNSDIIKNYIKEDTLYESKIFIEILKEKI